MTKNNSAVIFISVCFILLCDVNLFAAGQMKFTNISIAQGLSQITVYDITQSKSNHLWIATADGVNRYDSYTFTVYRHHPGDSLSIAGNAVRTLHADSSGLLWIGTTSGLSYYDAEQDFFRTHPMSGNDGCLEIYDQKDAGNNFLLLATNKGLLLFNKARGQYENRKHIRSLKATTLEKTDRQILVGTKAGLYLDIPETDQIHYDIEAPSTISQHSIRAIFPDNQGGMWLGTDCSKDKMIPFNKFKTFEIRSQVIL